MRLHILFILVFAILCYKKNFCQRTLYSPQKYLNTFNLQKNNITIKWEKVKNIEFVKGKKERFLSFYNAIYPFNDNLPYYILPVQLNINESFDLELYNKKWGVLSDKEKQIINKSFLENDVKIINKISYFRKKPIGYSFILPLRINPISGNIEKLLSFDFKINKINKQAKKNYKKNKSMINNSVLSSGRWYKIGVTKESIYKLTYSFLKNLGMDIDNVNPRNIRIYGNGGAMLPQENSAFRYDDLQENAILVIGENDGVFNKNDYILFYGQSPNRWNYDSTDALFHHTVNLYSDTTYYFITADLGQGKRVKLQTNLHGNENYIVNSYNSYTYHELDLENLIKSGRTWYGEKFDIITNYDFTFNIPNLENTQASITIALASRSINSASSFSLSAPGLNTSISLPAVSSVYYTDFVSRKISTFNFYPVNSIFTVSLQYNKAYSGAVAWLDYIEINARSSLTFNGNVMFFRDINSVGQGKVSKFIIQNCPSNINFWDVSNILDVKKQDFILNGSTASFVVNTDTLKEFCAFTIADSNVYAFGSVKNQNLHSLSAIDFVIVTNGELKETAQKLADFHISNDNLNVAVVTTQEIYNEFSSGKKDPSAIRDFMKMLYDKATNPSEMPKYLLLFGDGSYDNKNILGNGKNIIPAYESRNSYSPTDSYVSDDYYGLLDDNEGRWLPNDGDLPDIGIGRITVNSKQEAENVINKIFNYNTPASMKDWRNVICFVGDDEDGNLHMDQANQLANFIDTTYKDYNINKIFLDAYKQVSGAGGERYPDAKADLNKQVEQGALIVNYTGHGGELGWALERILEVSDINNWTNFYNLPLFVTATCEFSRWDNPARTSAGEYVLLNPSGGGIALLSTVRIVYSGQNFSLNSNFYKNVFKLYNNDFPTMGDIYLLTKIATGSSVNTRNFSLLGDPALKLAYPVYNVFTSKINGKTSDTLKALSKVTIEGYVADKNGNKLNNFNGILYPTVFDKESTIKTLNNDGNGVFTFKIRKNKIFKGKVSVNNGTFSFDFYVPKDIQYYYGKGKISYYTENGQIDGNGWYDNIIIGGTNPNAADDKKGPEILLYMNNENFVNGGITDENPVLIVKLWDEYGINVTTNSLGHAISAILDDDNQNPIILNDYYESDLDSYQSGTIKYPFKNLKPGRHTLKVKAWDIYNNSSEAELEFYVNNSSELVIEHLYNYPNPFTTHTSFYIEHNQPGRPINIQIQIFTVTGKLIKEIQTLTVSDGYREGPFEWDGKDEFGDKIGRGVYIYRARISNEFSKTEKYQKLVILN